MQNRQGDENFSSYWGRTHVNGPAPNAGTVSFRARPAREQKPRRCRGLIDRASDSRYRGEWVSNTTRWKSVVAVRIISSANGTLQNRLRNRTRAPRNTRPPQNRGEIARISASEISLFFFASIRVIRGPFALCFVFAYSERNMPQPVMLIIRDGWGINPHGRQFAEADGNATLLAHTPYHDYLYQTYPGSRSERERDGCRDCPKARWEIRKSDTSISAPAESFTRILPGSTRRSSTESCRLIPVIRTAFESAKHSRLHFIGLLSDGGVHSHQNHLIALVKVAAVYGVTDILIHAITDGRDTSPTGGAEYLATVQNAVAGSGAVISTVIGRYFAMDRDKRWERTKLAWDAIVLGRRRSCSELAGGRRQASIRARGNR